MSDVSTFIKRNGTDTEAINRLQTLITPMAFPDPEADSLTERVIHTTPKRLRVNTSSTGLDVSTVTTANRDRFSTAITIIPDSVTPSAFPVSPTLSGTLDLTNSIGKKFGSGALFNGTQYISIPDDNQFDLTLPIFTMAFWYKSDGVNTGDQTIWDKGQFGLGRDFCLTCGDFSDDFSTIEDVAVDAGIQVKLQGDLEQDFCSTCTDFDTSFRTSSTNERIKMIISDGTNIVEDSVDLLNLYDGNWHSIVLVSQDTVEDFCVSCTDFHTGDFPATASPVITVYYDKVSTGTIDHSTVTGDLSNSSDAILGAEDTLLENPLKGSLALFEYQATNWTTTDVDAYNDDARIRVTSQKVAYHFTGNDNTVTTLDKIY